MFLELAAEQVEGSLFPKNRFAPPEEFQGDECRKHNFSATNTLTYRLKTHARRLALTRLVPLRDGSGVHEKSGILARLFVLWPPENL